MQTTAIGTVAKSLPKNEVILLTLLISKRYIPYTDLRKHSLNAKYTQLSKDKLRIRQFTPHFKALHTLLIFRTTECNLKN